MLLFIVELQLSEDEKIPSMFTQQLNPQYILSRFHLDCKQEASLRQFPKLTAGGNTTLNQTFFYYVCPHHMMIKLK